MMQLKIAKDLSLPRETVTATTVIFGGKGMGKTNLAAVMAEELSAAGLRWAWLDPLGVSWGLRHSRDGTGPGIECLILGGPKGDIPIEPTGGAAVADVVVEETVNVLIDFSRKPSGEMWGVGEKIRFVTDYTHRLFQRQGELIAGRRREPLCQILDEAARYVPQMIPAGNPQLAMCVAAWQQVVEEGRNIGLGVCLVTQRSARINKDVSELADALFAFRTVGPNSLQAIMDWLGQHVEKSRIKDLSDQVRSLDVGDALVVSPGWLRTERVAHIRLRNTFDSSATPKAGERAKTAKGTGARPDLVKIRERMAATIEKAKAEDPKELQKLLADAKRELAKKDAILAEVDVRTKRIDEKLQRVTVKQVEVPVLKEGQAVRFEKAVAGLPDRIGDAVAPVVVVCREIAAALSRLNGHGNGTSGRVAVRPAVPVRSAPNRIPALEQKRAMVPAEGISGPEQRILDAIAWFESISIYEPELAAVAFLAGYTVGGGAFNNPRGSLRSKGLVQYKGDNLVLTDAGRAIANAPDGDLTAQQLCARVLARLPGPEQKLLTALINAYPTSLSNEDLAAQAGYAPDGGAFNNPKGRLRSLGLIEYPEKGRAVAKPLLFLEDR